jgi:hypothetical protein
MKFKQFIKSAKSRVAKYLDQVAQRVPQKGESDPLVRLGRYFSGQQDSGVFGHKVMGEARDYYQHLQAPSQIPAEHRQHFADLIELGRRKDRKGTFAKYDNASIQDLHDPEYEDEGIEVKMRKSLNKKRPGDIPSWVRAQDLSLDDARQGTSQTWPNAVKAYYKDKPENHIDPEQEIPITHGGGYHYLKDLVAGRVKGYRLEGNTGSGIQVHPNLTPEQLGPRHLYYASRGTTRFMDRPGELVGTIKAKNLLAAPNLYEAGLTLDNLKNVKNLQVNPIGRPGQEVFGNRLGKELIANPKGPSVRERLNLDPRRKQ